MNVRRYIFAVMIVMVALYACNNDDDDDFEIIPPRDAAEQQANEDPLIQEYLQTHFFDFIDNPANSNFQITVFDTIAGVNSDRVSIWDSGLLQTKTITRDDIDYTLYLLPHNSGVPTERQPTFADSTFMTFRGEQFYENLDEDGDGISNEADVDADGDEEADLIDEDDESQGTRTDSDNDGIADDSDVDSNPDAPDSDGDGIIDSMDSVDGNDPNRRVFDNAVNPIWLDMVSVIEGFREATIEFRGASNFTMPTNNGDGTVSFNMDFADFTVFMPSGLAYFDTPPLGTGIGTYKSILFTIQLYGSIETDHDGDGVPSFLEDLDGDGLVLDIDDDTDEDLTPNYLDSDDDGDNTLTENEDLELDTDLSVDRDGDGDSTNDIGDGDPTNDDTDGDGIPNYLDTDNSASRNDGS